MTEYIEKKALMVALCKEIIGDGDYYNGKDDMQDQIRDMVSRFPAADVAPVRHARWDENGMCSNCGGHAPFWCMASTYYKSPWCQECGAKMDGDDNA